MDKGNKGRNIWFDKALLESKAFMALGTPTAHKVLAIFWTKRQMEQLGRKGKKQWNIKNNGEIVFTFLEAEKEYGILTGAFQRAIDELREKGFIDIAASGQGVHKVANLYTISNRWKDYGTDNYKPPRPRKKGPINRGFQKGNQLGRNCKKRKS
jgi:hypothetical protein